MKMTIRFDGDKLLEYGLTEEEAMEPIREFFERKGIPEVSDGVFFYNGDGKIGAFSCTASFPDKFPYFLDCVEIWDWDLDDHIEHCKADFIEVQRAYFS